MKKSDVNNTRKYAKKTIQQPPTIIQIIEP